MDQGQHDDHVRSSGSHHHALGLLNSDTSSQEKVDVRSIVDSPCSTEKPIGPPEVPPPFRQEHVMSTAQRRRHAPIMAGACSKCE